MDITRIALTKRASVTLLNLDRDSLMYPLAIGNNILAAPEITPGMTHDQAVAAPGDYQDAYNAYLNRASGITNAAVIGWAMDVNNIANFADNPPEPSVLTEEIAAQELLFEAYAADFTGWVDHPVVNRGLKLTAIVSGLRRMSPIPFDTISAWLDETYKRWGVIDEKLVGDAIKSESGDGGGGAGAGSGEANPAGVEEPPI